MVALLLAAALAAPVPRAALFDEAPATAAMARVERRSETLRSVGEYAAALAAFTLFNAGGSALLSQARVTVSRGNVSLAGSEAALAGAGVCFALSPLAGAIASWLVGRGSDAWDPSLGWATAGAYGTSLVAVGAGLGIAAANVDRGTAVAANAALYLAVPLGTVLFQNATKSPRP